MGKLPLSNQPEPESEPDRTDSDLLSSAAQNLQINSTIAEIDKRKHEINQKIKTLRKEAKQRQRQQHKDYRKIRKALLLKYRLHRKQFQAERARLLHEGENKLAEIKQRKAIFKINKEKARALKNELEAETKDLKEKTRSLKGPSILTTDEKLQSEIKAINKQYNLYKQNKLEQINKLYKISKPTFTRQRLQLTVAKKIREQNLRSYIFLIIGSLGIVIGFDFFILPANLFSAGIAAPIQAIVYHFFDTKIEQQVFYFILFTAVNIPFFIFGYFKVGRAFTLKTLFYIILLNGFNSIVSFTPLHNLKVMEPLLKESYYAGAFIMAIIGAIIYGLALGCLFYGGASSGGTDFIAAFFSLKKSKNVGNMTRIFNFINLLIALFISFGVGKDHDFWNFFFGRPILFASVIFIFIVGGMVNFIYPKFKIINVMVVTKIPKEVLAAMTKAGYRNEGILLKLTSVKYNNEKTMIMTAMSMIEYKSMENAILLADPEAFITQTKINKTIGSKAFLRI